MCLRGLWLRLQIKVTELRTNQAYVTYYNQWARLLVMGFIPAVMLIYFNYKVNITISHLVNLQELHLALPVDLQGHKVAAAAAEAERGEPGHPQPPGKVSLLELDIISQFLFKNMIDVLS